MIKVTPLKSYLNLMVNMDFNVVHPNFQITVNYMVGFNRNEQNNNYEIDVMDYCGVRNLCLHGVMVNDSDINEYFNLLNRMGIDHLNECLDEVEKVIKGFTDDDINQILIGDTFNQSITVNTNTVNINY